MSTADSVTLIYGAGGLGKSTLLAQACAHVWKKHGLRSRVVNADGGGTAAALSALIDEGITSVWHIDQWSEKSIFALLDLATKGWWPADPSTPNSPLLPPVEEYRLCPACGERSGATALAMVKACEKCKTPFAAGTLLPVTRTPINGMEGIGLVGFEGMTSFGSLLLNRFRAVDPGGGQVIKDGDYAVAQAGQSHYGMAQNHLMQCFQNCRSIPTKMVMWTALEIRADDEGKPMYGPAGPGKALTNRCIPCFTSVLHLDAFPKKQGGAVVKDAAGVEVVERRLFLAPHYPPDAPHQLFKAKTSAPFGGGMPTSIEPSMDLFFSEMDKARAKAREALFGTSPKQ